MVQTHRVLHGRRIFTTQSQLFLFVWDFSLAQLPVPVHFTLNFSMEKRHSRRKISYHNSVILSRDQEDGRPDRARRRGKGAKRRREWTQGLRAWSRSAALDTGAASNEILAVRTRQTSVAPRPLSSHQPCGPIRLYALHWAQACACCPEPGSTWPARALQVSGFVFLVSLSKSDSVFFTCKSCFFDD